MKNKSLYFLSLLIAFGTVVLFSCNKKFDEPPVATTSLADMGITATHTIAQLKAMGGPSGTFIPITDTVVIKGVITANDESGNLYKQIYMQDASGGIEIDLDATNLYTSFRVGREVAVYCKDLWLANVNGMYKVCVRTVANNVPSVLGVPATLINTKTKLGAIDQPVVAKVVNIADLTTDLLGSLIQIQGVEIPDAQLGYLWADTSANKNSQNVTIRNCSGDNIIIRSSAYANFAGQSVPQGKGNVTAIYTIFNTTKQLIIRDASDADMNGIRCDGTDPNVPPTIMTIQQIRAMNVGDSIPSNTAIRGVIVSNTLNESAGNYRIQDSSGYGIQLRFPSAANPNFSVNDKVQVWVSKIPVELFNGDLQLNNVGRSKLLGSGSVTPRVTTVADITTNINTWASTVVKLNNVTIAQTSSSSTGINYSITDATGNIVSFVRSTLGYVMPVSAASITGYVSSFNGTPQLTIRLASDIVGGVFPNYLLNEGFESYPTGTTAANIPGWQNIMETGDVFYTLATFSNNKFAKISAYSSTALPTTNISSWLITPGISLPTGSSPKFSFTCSRRYPTGTFTAYVSTNYTGGSPSTATWTPLVVVPPAAAGAPFTPFDPFGPYDLSAYAGQQVNVAFRYEVPAGTVNADAATFEVDDVRIYQ